MWKVFDLEFTHVEPECDVIYAPAPSALNTHTTVAILISMYMDGVDDATECMHALKHLDNEVTPDILLEIIYKYDLHFPTDGIDIMYAINYVESINNRSWIT